MKIRLNKQVRFRTAVILGLIFCLYLSYLIGGFFISNNMKGEVHYIPSGFIGEVFVIFEQREGVEKEFFNEKRVYRVPKSGVIQTQFRPNTGWMESDTLLEFYYVDQSGIRQQRLPYVRTFAADTMRNEIGIHGIKYFSISSDDLDVEFIYLKYLVDSVSKKPLAHSTLKDLEILKNELISK